MNLSHLNFLGFIGGLEPLPPRVAARQSARAKGYPHLVLLKKPEEGTAQAAPALRNFSDRFLLGGVPVVAAPAHFFRAFGAAKNQGRKTPGRPVAAKPNYVEVTP